MRVKIADMERDRHSTPPTTPAHRKPLRLRNVVSRNEAFDTLHFKVSEPTQCSQKTCLGSLMALPGRTTLAPRTTEELLRHAKDFLDQYFTSIRRFNSPAHAARWEQVQKSVNASGTYELSETELVYGAKLAWRNSVRCIGRIQWSKLQVFDCRQVTTTSGMFEALCNHIKYSTNKGNIRSAITVFPQRTDGKHDFKVWNPQLLSYAGYKNPDGTITGDPGMVEFTEVCLKLGWKSPRTSWDILPLVLQANGHDPDYFDIPPELVLQVHITHPTYEWFEKLGLRWYCVPAVANMMFDCGGLEFTAAPFNGWYMSTEIGCRNLCDTHRLNILETVAAHMGLDTRTPITLWKDKAMVEVNIAVLHSFQLKCVTIVDHHTASESFMKHYENEMRLRNGCPGDWIWIVPPLSGSACPVFHQEMALYMLKPSYEYQELAWKCHVWKKGRESGKSKKPRRKFHFKQIARAVKFTSKLFGRALSRRIKATVLYATETGKSETYAKKLGEIFGHAFNSQVYCMADYDMSSIEHEALLLVVTSTFGNGDPPENGEEFAQSLYAMKMNSDNDTQGDEKKFSMASSKSFIKANSQTELAGLQTERKLDRLDSLKGSVSDVMSEDTFGPLSNVRFAVFALGSSAYPNFCAFGKYVDNLLGELGGERLLKMCPGDEMCGQEQAFRKWAPEVFGVACETFCLDDDETFLEATMALQGPTLSASTVRFVETKEEKLAPESLDLAEGLSKCHGKKVSDCHLARKVNLHGDDASRATMLLQIASENAYQPGDHVGVFPCNRPEIVEGILKRLQSIDDPDKPVELQIQKENHTANGVVKTWVPHERLPSCSLRTLLTRFLDITTPPTPDLLQHLASIATNPEEQEKLSQLATEPTAYEDWRHWRFPHLLEVLEEFPSVCPSAPLLVAQLPLLQPRFYSISSSPSVYAKEIHITVAVVVYKTQDGEGPLHYGVCSNYLRDMQENDHIYLFVRSAPSFYLPSDLSRPVIMVGPGTGIAPFRGFWQHRMAQIQANTQGTIEFGKMWLFFGCRSNALDLYRDEKATMVKEKVLDKVFLALSREPNIPKTYVQDLIRQEAATMYQKLVVEGGHFYVCGDCTMAEHVYQTLKAIIQEHGSMSDGDVESYMLKMRDENRYHEDIFGITLRTAEVHNRSRETARIRMTSQP
ncbi:nitric oxide synthase, salivary gland [Anabrus simplex]|uniref:nitric oxide synthase, salivary gland n=1 Tax=Anabrus simplex TaxID=316456 RepID=UPI0034DD8F84